MGCFTIYCAISGLPLEINTYISDDDLENKKHPNYGQTKETINNNNDVKYSHLNEVIVILPDSSVSEVGYCDGYGRVEMCNSDQVYECDSKDGIAISNSIYKLMKDDPRFKTLMENKALFSKVKNYRLHIDTKKAPYLKKMGAQQVCIMWEDYRGGYYHVDPMDLWSYVDPFLTEKVEEPFLGKTFIRQTYRKLNGKKSKLLYESMINDFLK